MFPSLCLPPVVLLHLKSFKVATEKYPFLCTLGLICVRGTLSRGQIQVIAPLKTGLDPECNSCLSLFPGGS